MPKEVLTGSKTLPKIGVILCRVLIVVSELIGIEVGTNNAEGNKTVELTDTLTDDEGIDEADSVTEGMTHNSVAEVLCTFFSGTWS